LIRKHFEELIDEAMSTSQKRGNMSMGPKLQAVMRGEKFVEREPRREHYELTTLGPVH
jgi:hypothetical protein